uniref:ATP-dependent DNA ligase family profile domain-containing protein n=1 Tax=Phaseolus vulgaris TaxID=3885 RepID=V7BUY4_PHAVU|nr:hypothetical protein PHAVU_005G021200g [Phaseolus vulgaris]ESW20865.1 hypothetical protein PHAVU_005G021200g [Phaseolus vulgaris]
MSKPPSALDFLMSVAAAAAAVKKNSQSKPQTPKLSSSLKKRKSPNSTSVAKKRKSPHSTSSQNPTVKPEQVLKPKEVLKPEEVLKAEEAVKAEEVVEMEKQVQQLRQKPSSFDPASVTAWEKGQPVPFLFLALAFDMIDEETSKTVITDIACNMLRTVMVVTPEDLVPIVYLSASRIAPPHEGLELGIGDSIIIKTFAEAYGKEEELIRTQYQKKGDLGLLVKESRSSQSTISQYYKPQKPPEALTIRKVFNTFRLIAKESGKDSQEIKKNHIKALLVAATECEPQYLIRLLQAKLRIGYAEQTLLAALGQAAVYSEEHSRPPPHFLSYYIYIYMCASDIVKQVYSVLPDYDKIISALLREGLWMLPKKFLKFTPGVPIRPMLPKAVKTVPEILKKFQGVEFTCEYKYDGERAQIHYLENGKVEIYSRQEERNTEKFPDVIEAVSR